jgi:hypothetical protein
MDRLERYVSFVLGTRLGLSGQAAANVAEQRMTMEAGAAARRDEAGVINALRIGRAAVLVSSDSFTSLTHEWRGKELYSGGACDASCRCLQVDG